jgi:ABC-type microcin C transport system duplicated ATPase subunit YejF
MDTSAQAILSCRNLSVAYGDKIVVRDFSLALRRGQSAALVGESGSGKSQAMLAALRLLPIEAKIAGSVKFEGADLIKIPEKQLNGIRGKRIAFVFQEPMSSLDPLFTVGSQAAAVLTHKLKLTPAQAKARVLELFEEVGIPDPERRARAYPHELSGGQRQRVSIAMAIACDPDVLIADEPTTALDVTVAARILDLLTDLKQKRGMALIFISHDLGLVQKFADEIHVMQKGEIVESGPAEAVIRKPSHPYTKMLLNAVPPARSRSVSASSSLLLEAKDVSVKYFLRGGFFQWRKSFLAVDHVSVSLRKGETLGIVGESGSGKSTLARALLKLVPCSGKVTFADCDLSRLSPRVMRALRRYAQLVFQDPFGSLSPRMRVGDIVTEGLLVHEPRMSANARDARAIAALEEVKLDPAVRHRFPHEFSGGQRQRIAIARAMILKPRLVVLDEPTSALDRSVQAEILALLADLQRAHDLSYILISHDLAVVRAMADEIAVMHNGKIVESGRVEDIFERPRQPYTQTLIAAAH